ncbi:MAG: formate C-acetyltransferase/glycerol dehydratase family glycyl radical enzyme, partial [Spirochaetes bacterium]
MDKKDLLPLQERSLNGRIRKLKKAIAPGAHPIFLKRSLLYLESYRITEGEHTIIRRAKALENILKKIPITIQSDQRIVGGRTPSPRMGVPATEGDVEWLYNEIDSLPERKQEPFLVDNKNKEIFFEVIYPYFRDKTLKKWIESNLSDEVKEGINQKVFNLNQTTHSQGHILPDVSKWLEQGINGLIDEVKSAERQYSSSNTDSNNFYEAVLITLKAASTFINRYAELAEEMGLTDIAKRCRKLAEFPPESFADAVQSLWFLFVILHLESIGSSFSPGRLDQILYPYYKKDIERGVLTSEEALDLIEELYIKFNEVVLLRSEDAARYFAGFPIGFNVALGGQNEMGEDATNELSYLFL